MEMLLNFVVPVRKVQSRLCTYTFCTFGRRYYSLRDYVVMVRIRCHLHFASDGSLECCIIALTLIHLFFVYVLQAPPLVTWMRPRLKPAVDCVHKGACIDTNDGKLKVFHFITYILT